VTAKPADQRRGIDGRALSGIRPSARDGRAVLLTTAVWFVVAVGLGAAGVFKDIRPPLPQIILATLTAAVLILFWTPTPFRRWALAVDSRALVLIHVTRFVGFYFLWLYSRGELPWAFAVPGGWGDVAVAATAILVCLLTRPDVGSGRGVLIVWNVFGLVDILMVVTTAVRLAVADPGSMAALLRLPLSLLISFLVPIIIATHVIIFAKALGARAAP
jgi:hypothetical protein